MAGMVYSNNRHSAKHITCSLLYMFTSMWFLGTFTTLIIYPTAFNAITIYWVNGSITIGALLSLHLWLMNASMYNKKNGKYLKLLFLPGILMMMTFPIDSWMLKGNGGNSLESMFTPGLGLYLLWVVDFLYLTIILVLTVIEMKKGNNAAKIWFKGIVLYFIWTVCMLTVSILLQNTSFYFFLYLIPHGSLFWAIAIFLSMSRFDYLSSYEKRYHILFERSPLGILIMDEETIVQEASPKILQYLGVTRQELIQSRLISFLSGIDEAEYIKEHQKLFKNQIKLENSEMSFMNKSGEQMTLLVDSDFIMVEGKTLQFVMTKDITEAKAKEEKIKYLAYHDILTGLANRAAFEKQITSLISRKEMFNLLLLDLNKLKKINDTFGHQAGDLAIQHIADILRKATEGKHHTARLGGDEFVMLLNVENTEKTIENIHQQLAIPLKVSHNQQIRLSASIGVSCYPFDGETIDQLYSIADKRMYVEKYGA
jgi:diguanylate cyclase (GGDEF)-like protein/PAS domain S-box-containing protein